MEPRPLYRKPCRDAEAWAALWQRPGEREPLPEPVLRAIDRELRAAPALRIVPRPEGTRPVALPPVPTDLAGAECAPITTGEGLAALVGLLALGLALLALAVIGALWFALWLVR